MKRFGAVTIVALLMAASLLGVLSVTGSAQAAWSGTGTVEPASGYPNQTVGLYFELTNDGTRSMTISKAVYEYDWGNTTSTVTLRGNLTVDVDETTNLSGSFTVPDIEPGTYQGNVTITAKGALDLLATTKRYPAEFTVKEVTPLAVTVRASPASGAAPLNVSFDATVKGGVGPYTYAWSLGDGASDVNATVEHQYARSGGYNAAVVVTDSLGNRARDNITIKVAAAPLSVAISSTDVNGLVPLTVTLSCVVTGGAAPYSYSWTTGDGGTFDGDSFAHDYREAGTYTVRLVVTDADGNTDRDLITIVVLSESDQAIDPVVGTPLQIGPLMMAYIFVFVVASVSVVGFMIYRNRTRFRR